MSTNVDYNGIGKRIRYYRKLHDMSQEALAEKVDISVTHMSHIETGSTKLSLPVLISIADALEVNIDHLVHDKAEIESDYHYEIEALLNDSSLKEQRMLFNAMKSLKNSLDDSK